MIKLNSIEVHRSPYLISTDVSRFDLPKTHQMITNSYWAANIPFDIYKLSVENSLSFGVYHELDGQVGLARVISDYATYAYLGDVLMHADHRGHGLGKWLIQTIVEHPNLQKIRSFRLETADAHGLYAQFGWEPIANPHKSMVKQVFKYKEEE
ncbi:MAG: GNAT family N-acetyltransferase [Chloroflexota bacterium]